jgi:nitrate reductase gamma subunit
MNAMVSFLAVVGLGLLVLLGVTAGLEGLFGIVLPYIAIVLFLTGFVYRIVTWARSPVPFRIPTTGGQQESLDFIRPARFDNPSKGWGVVGRMILEILFFRSLFRNTEADMRDGPRLVYGARKALWLFAILFHWTFLVIFLRHLRFFTEPVPGCVGLLEGLDGFFDITVPTLYVTDLVIVAALGFLLIRRFYVPQVRYISQAADYFPLFLLLGIVLSGIYIRYLGKTDVAGIKELGMGLLAFSPSLPTGASAGFYLHLFLVTVLIAYFPFSKLMHMGGVFLSPTRNLANNNRAVRHVNPWNAPVRLHDFEHWKEEFAEEIAEAGYELKGE